MVTIPIAYAPPAPEFAKMVMRTCSLTLKGPGFIVHFQLVKGTLYCVVGKTAAIIRPKGRAAIWADIAVMVSGSDRYEKNWLRKARIAHDKIPNVHIRNVYTGVDGSSRVETVRATCSIGDWSGTASSPSRHFNLWSSNAYSEELSAPRWPYQLSQFFDVSVSHIIFVIDHMEIFDTTENEMPRETSTTLAQGNQEMVSQGVTLCRKPGCIIFFFHMSVQVVLWHPYTGNLDAPSSYCYLYLTISIPVSRCPTFHWPHGEIWYSWKWNSKRNLNHAGKMKLRCGFPRGNSMKEKKLHRLLPHKRCKSSFDAPCTYC